MSRNSILFGVALLVLLAVSSSSGQENEDDDHRVSNCFDFDDNCPTLVDRNSITRVNLKDYPCMDVEFRRKCPKSCDECLPLSPFKGCEDLMPELCKKNIQDRNDCHKNPRHYIKLCAKTCKACPPASLDDCAKDDLHPSCYLAGVTGMCKSQDIFYQTYCPRSCGLHIKICSKNRGKINPTTTRSICGNKKFVCGDSQEAGVAAVVSDNPSESSERTKRQIQHKISFPVKDNSEAASYLPPYKPYTQKPYIRRPYTQKPYTQRPYTRRPYTRKPYTQRPYTRRPYTQKPYTQKPYTRRPTTTTQRPTTTTQRPTTTTQRPTTTTQRLTTTTQNTKLDKDRDRTLVPFCKYDEFFELFLILEKAASENSGFPMLDEIEDLILDINFCQYGINKPFDRRSFVNDIYNGDGLLQPPSGYTGIQYSTNSKLPVRPLKKRSIRFSFDEPSMKSRHRRQAGGDNDVGKHAVKHEGLDDSNRDLFNCGGALISDYHAITAAHCLYRKRKPKFTRLGERDFSKINESTAFDYNISTINIHEDYNNFVKIDDIAIVSFKHKVDFTKDIEPYCLPPGHINLSDREYCYVSGWGVRKANPLMTATVLTSMQLQLLDLEECTKNYSVTLRGPEIDLFLRFYPNGTLPDSVFCAGGVNDSVCQGDSGGPANIINDDNKFETVGVVNKGYGCFNIQFPGIYTRVDTYSKWIDDKLFGDCDDLQTRTTTSTTTTTPATTTTTPATTTKNYIYYELTFFGKKPVPDHDYLFKKLT